MEIKNYKQLKKAKLSYKYEMELAKLEAEVAGSRLTKYTKLSGLVELLFSGSKSRGISIVSVLAGVVAKLFTSKQ